MQTTLSSGRHASWSFAGRLVNLIVPILCLVLAGYPAHAQSSGLGTISGTVTDPSGAVIPGAQVTVVNVATNVTWASVSNGTGYFEVNSLIAGAYRVTIAAPGFQSLVREGITLEAGTTAKLALSMKTGSVSETVTVSADASLLNTDSGSGGQVMTTKQLESLPVTGTNPMWFIDLAPGVQATMAQSASQDGTLNWNGESTGLGTAGIIGRNEYSLDGAPNMDGRANSVNVDEDEMGEMKIDATGFDASVGKTMGVSITQTTKPGTNQIHGSFRESYQNKRWSAMDHFQGLTHRYEEALTGCNGSHSTPQCLAVENTYGWPGIHENDGAISLGGPITVPHVFSGHDRLFFFTSLQEDIYAGSGGGTTTIPTIQERSGNFSDLPPLTANGSVVTFGSGNLAIPALIQNACPAGTPYYGQYQIYDPYSTALDSSGIPRRTPICGNVLPANRLLNGTMASFYNNLMPTPNQGSSTGNNFGSTSKSPQTYRTYAGRVDWAVSQKDHVSFRYTRANYTSQGISTVPLNNVGEQLGPRWIDVGAVGWNHVFSPKTNLDITIGGQTFKTECCYYPNYEKSSPTTLGLPSYTTAYAGSRASLPILSINSYSGLGQNNNVANTTRNLAFRANLTQVYGGHTIRSGGEYRFQNQSQPSQGNTFGTYSFDNTYIQENNGRDANFSATNVGLSYAAFLMGVQTTSSVAYQAALSISTPYYALYTGDTWRVTPKLTVIPGIRFEWESGPLEKHNGQIVGWNPTAPLPELAPANAAYAAARSAATAAQQAVLPASLTIQGGPVYAGANGAPTKQFGNSYRIMPRMAFAYQVRRNTVVRGGYGMFFDTLNALTASLDQDGFSASTSVPSSTNFGQNFATYPANNITPLSDPFPAGAGGARFNAPVGSAAGAMYYAGAAPTNIYDQGYVPGRQHRGYFGIQHQFGSSTMVEVAGTAALTTNLDLSQPQNPIPAGFYSAGLQPNTAMNNLLGSTIPNPFALANFSGVASSNPAAYGLMSRSGYFTSTTDTVANLVRAYPQLSGSGFTIHKPMGESKFEELQVNVNRRFSRGLTLMASFQANHDLDRDYFYNSFDASPSWEGSNSSLPVRFTSEWVYSLPFGRGHAWANSGVASAILGGFQFSGLYEAQPGSLVTFGNVFYLGEMKASNIKLQHPIYVNGQTFINGVSSNGSNYVQWLNPGNVVATPVTVNNVTTCSYSGTGFVTNTTCQPNSYNLRAFPRRISGVRQMGVNEANMNVERTFSVMKERVSLTTRFEAVNVFNHQGLGGPNTTVTSAQFGWVTGNGFPNQNGRWINISGRLRW